MGNTLLQWVAQAAGKDNTGSYRLTEYQRMDGIDYCTDGFRAHVTRSPDGPVPIKQLFLPLSDLRASAYVDAMQLREGSLQAIASMPRSFKVAKIICYVVFPDGQMITVDPKLLAEAVVGTGKPLKVRVGMWSQEKQILIHDDERCAMVMPLNAGLQSQDWPWSQEAQRAQKLADPKALRLVTFVRDLPYLAGEAHVYPLEDGSKLFYPTWLVKQVNVAVAEVKQ